MVAALVVETERWDSAETLLAPLRASSGPHRPDTILRQWTV